MNISLSQAEDIRLPGIEWNDNGQWSDPRETFTPQFQMLLVGTEEFGAWATGTWEQFAPQGGPYVARITVGPGQPDAVNPGVAGTYRMYIRYFQASGETPASPCGVITLAAP